MRFHSFGHPMSHLVQQWTPPQALHPTSPRHILREGSRPTRTTTMYATYLDFAFHVGQRTASGVGCHHSRTRTSSFAFKVGRRVGRRLTNSRRGIGDAVLRRLSLHDSRMPCGYEPKRSAITRARSAELEAW